MKNLVSRILTLGTTSKEENFENHIRQWFPIAHMNEAVASFLF